MVCIHNLIKRQPFPTISLNEAIVSDDIVDYLDLIMDGCNTPEEEEVFVKDFDEIYNSLLEMPNGQITIDKIMHNKTYKEIGESLGLSKPRILQIHKKNIDKLRNKFMK